MIHCILLLCYSSTIAACHNLSPEANSSLQSCILVSERQGKPEFTAHHIPFPYAQHAAKNGKLAGVGEKQERGCSLKEKPGKSSNNTGTGQGAGDPHSGWAELKWGPSKDLGEAGQRNQGLLVPQAGARMSLRCGHLTGSFRRCKP